MTRHFEARMCSRQLHEISEEGPRFFDLGTFSKQPIQLVDVFVKKNEFLFETNVLRMSMISQVFVNVCYDVQTFEFVFRISKGQCLLRNQIYHPRCGYPQH
jgi:hypothetical protein